MKKQIPLAITGALALSAAAHAELTHFSAFAQELFHEGQHYGYVRIFAHFNDPTDTISSVVGTPTHPLTFDLSGSTLTNFGDFGGWLPTDDDPGHHQYDSFVGFSGDLAQLAAQKSEDFWGVPGGGQTTGVLDDGIMGLSDTNTSYFLQDPVAVGSIDSQNKVLIAQFVSHPEFGLGHVAGFMKGRVFYNGDSHRNINVDWNYVLPGPSALGLLILAGGAGGRRRRS